MLRSLKTVLFGECSQTASAVSAARLPIAFTFSKLKCYNTYGMDINIKTLQMQHSAMFFALLSRLELPRHGQILIGRRFSRIVRLNEYCLL